LTKSERNMSVPRDGATFYSLLTSLNHPAAASLSPESLDWVCEAPGCEPFLDWFLSNITKDNVLSDEELEAWRTIPEDKVLSGQILNEALSSLGFSDGQRMTDAELEKQVNMLEVELNMMEQSRDKLSHIRENRESLLSSSQTQLTEMEHLVERVELEERRAQEMMLQLNNQYNKTVSDLVTTTNAVSRLFESASEDMENPAFAASINLEKIRAANMMLDIEIEKLMEEYFNKESENDDSDPSYNHEVYRGRNQAEYETMISEMERLRVSWVSQEFERIQLAAQEDALISVLAALSNKEIPVSSKDTTGTLPVPDIIAESDEAIEEEIVKTLNDIAGEYCKKILNVDYINKEFRNRIVIKKLVEIKNVLIQQVAKREILAILIHEEKKEVEGVETMLKDIIKIFKDEDVQLTNFNSAMKCLSGKKSESEANLISSEDVVMIHVHKILFNHQLVGHVPTYNQVFEVLESLKEKQKTLEKQTQLRKLSQTDDLKSATRKVENLFNLLDITESNASLVTSLSPHSIKNGILQLEKVMKDIKVELKKVSDNWDQSMKELKLKPETALVRNMWVDFLVKPKTLLANIKNLENKANR